MSNQTPKANMLGRKSALVAAGLLAASATFVLMPGMQWSTSKAAPQNPVIAKVLSDAKKHRAKGRLEQAASLLAQHARPENPEILLNYAKLLARGQGVERNLDKARDKLLLAVQHDFAKWGEAAFELGRVYRQSIGPDCERIAFEWFIESARAGHMPAHAELGRHYSRGIGVDVDMPQALEHYRIAARAGYANSLVSFISKVTRSANPAFSESELKTIVSEAIPALEREAAGGRGSSAKVLGRLYKNGVLVTADAALSEMWFERGARLGDSGSMVELALTLLAKPDAQSLARRSVALLQKAASLRNAGAYTELGRLHSQAAFGLAKSDARDWFERGVAAGHAGSMMELAKLQLQGKPGKGKLQEIAKLLKLGAAKGHLGCQRLLAELTRDGKIKISAAAASKLVSMPSEMKKVLRKPSIKAVVGQLSQLKKLRQLAEQKRASKVSRGSGSPLTGATVITPFNRGS